MALSENSVVGLRGSNFFFGCIRLLAQPRFGRRKPLFSPGEDADLSAIALAKAGAGDVGFIVDAAGCSQVDNPVAFVQPLLR